MGGIFKQIGDRVSFFLQVCQAYKQYLSHANLGARLMLSQIYFTALQPLPALMALAFFLGIFVMVQSSARLSAIGGIQPIGNVLVFALFREIIPIVVLLVVIGRSVTGITSEIATMKVQGELRLYRALGVSVEGLLYFPRLWGPAVGVMGLAVICVLTAYAGAYVTAILYYNLNP